MLISLTAMTCLASVVGPKFAEYFNTMLTPLNQWMKVRGVEEKIQKMLNNMELSMPGASVKNMIKAKIPTYTSVLETR